MIKIVYIMPVEISDDPNSIDESEVIFLTEKNTFLEASTFVMTLIDRAGYTLVKHIQVFKGIPKYTWIAEDDKKRTHIYDAQLKG